jgi:hypothetical protein
MVDEKWIFLDNQKPQITGKMNMYLTCDLVFIKQHIHLYTVFYSDDINRNMSVVSVKLLWSLHVKKKKQTNKAFSSF